MKAPNRMMIRFASDRSVPEPRLSAFAGLLALALLAITDFGSNAVAEQHTSGMAMAMGNMHARPDGRAPAGVMGDHIVMKGAFSIAYQAMSMEMDGSRSGNNRLSDAEVLAAFPVTTRSMTMDMQMLSAMYGWSNDLSLMVMAPYLDITMPHLTRTGVRFTTQSKGVGDVSLSGIYRLFRAGKHELLANAGISLPTGSIDKTDATPLGPGRPLPYSMQPGSGTFDLMPGITYRGNTEDFSWGGQAGATLRLGRNDADYSLGDRYRVGAWVARLWTDWFSSSLRANFEDWGDVDGADARLNQALVPTAVPTLRGGSRLDLFAGVNFVGTGGHSKASACSPNSVYRSIKISTGRNSKPTG
jgi:hypothetical protein